MTAPRRRFLSWLGSASLLGVASRPSLAPLTRHVSPDPDAPHDAPIAATWDMSWTARVTGKYKAAFDSPEVAGGAALYRANAWCDQYKEVYGAARTEMSPVIVLRHLGFMLAMNDTFWTDYEVGKRLKMRDDRGRKWATTNPLGSAPPDAKAEAIANTVPGFIAAGGIVLACGWTFAGAVSQIAARDKIDRAAADTKARSLLIPGVILQPNGIFAVLRAQEAGCSYVLAS
ncbi:MAG: hypothetical protein V4813_07325 [Gemmatimonadota bacterium]